MDRRSFLGAAAAGATALGSGAAFMRWQEIAPTLHYPGMAEGHFLRDRRSLPAPREAIDTDIVIFGSGIAALTAAWKLRKQGHPGALMIDGPQPFGNAAGGRSGELAYPTGAHYLPLPGPEAAHVRELLADLGIIKGGALEDKPYYDEAALLHAPHERLLFNGSWHDAVIPAEGLGADELREHQRFFAQVEQLRQARGADGRRMFAMPSALSSGDPRFDELDTLTFRGWLSRNGYRSPALLWYMDYCCRDDYGADAGKVSAWAGLHYFCSRTGQAANAGDGAWLTWPGGLQPVASAMAQVSKARRMAGTVMSVRRTAGGIEALCFTLENGAPRTFYVRARKAICAMPLHVAARVVEGIGRLGFDVHRDMPVYAPWLVANFTMKDFPHELEGAPLAWDNVVYGGRGLGYVVSTHQDIRAAPPSRTVFTSYVALNDRSPQDARRWMQSATAGEIVELAAADLKAAYGWKFAACVERADITLRGHAMAVPAPGFRANAGARALREADGPILFAHGDLSGFSLFEEASWWGYRAAGLALA
ncbi:NAD(P)/FAD-dependent oxidoreductase [Massilia cavernae]|uniref:NAD(P)/FAD-dependent oxidoreductase n=1 Tax=Massilia cavernae TaxID=2320864 RepID=A0A418XAJ1_9BURK|nr:NAD(P)/FAD-dependent oxidoreductase [Massilia cavernae]RJG09529.1 NAD(P)/FAD-dependent oxidoreductase [Massilia cavernae]